MAYDKAVDSAVLDAGLTKIANAIRAKGGTTGNMEFPDGFTSLIDAIEAGGGGVGNTIKIDSGTFTPAEDVQTYKITPSIQVDNLVVQVLLPNVEGYGRNFAPVNYAGAYFGYELQDQYSGTVGSNLNKFSSATGEMLAGGSFSDRTYAHLTHYKGTPYRKPFSTELILGNPDAKSAMFKAGVEYLWFRVGY